MRRWTFAVLAVTLIAPAYAADWTYNMAFTQWSGSNDADRYYTNTPEACDERAAEIAAAGYDAVICSGYHFRLNWLDHDEDVRKITRMIVEACHNHGLKVIEHLDLTVAYYDAYPLAWANPDWFQLHAADMMTRHRIFCLNNPEFQRFYLDYVQRFQRETGVDAWQMDEISWLGRGFCGCRWCREKWREEKGRDYPAVEGPGFFGRALKDPDYREWMRWRGKCINDFYDTIREGLVAINPEVVLFDYTTTPQSSPWAWTRGAPYEVQAKSVDTIGTELNPVPFDSYPYIAGLLAQRRALGEVAGLPAWAKFDITDPSAYFCWAFGRTVGHSIWWSLRPDNDVIPPERLLEWPWQMDDQTAQLDADIGVLLSGSTRDLVREFDYFSTEFEGWLQALLLHPFATRPIIESELAQSDALDDYKLIVLPNATAISPEQKAALMAYVRAGGRLLLTYEAGTLNHDGAPSEDPLLAEAGVTLLDESASIEGGPDVPMHRIETEPDTRIVVEAEGMPLLTSREVDAGEIWYYAPRAGKLAFEQRQLPAKYSRGGGYTPPEAPRMVDELAEIATEVLQDTIYFEPAVAPDDDGDGRLPLVNAPRGLLAWVYEAEHDGRPGRCIHLLNCTGRDYEEGEPIEFDHENPPPTPSLPDLTLYLPGDVSEAVFATPEKTGSRALSVTDHEGMTATIIPRGSFETYGVVWAYDE